MINLPEYQCHKKVKAAKITRIEKIGSNTYELVLEGKLSSIDIDSAFIAKNNPQPGGYLVIYGDGYMSYSPAKAFEDGYSRL